MRLAQFLRPRSPVLRPRSPARTALRDGCALALTIGVLASACGRAPDEAAATSPEPQDAATTVDEDSTRAAPEAAPRTTAPRTAAPAQPPPETAASGQGAALPEPAAAAPNVEALADTSAVDPARPPLPPQESDVPIVAALRPGIIYSADDVDVQPPVWHRHAGVIPQVPGSLHPMPAVELVVSADGSVERARLHSGVRLLTDMSILSVAKTWRFDPALKEGGAVRYRLLVDLNDTSID